jgi:hypothetical protein
VSVSARIAGIRPNQSIYYRLAGRDKNVIEPELLTSEIASFKTSAVIPRVIGSPSTPFVGSSSVVMFAELNPENAASEYFFEYGAALGAYCEGTARTSVRTSAIYGQVGVTLEAGNLQPGVTYVFRLCVLNQTGKAIEPVEGEFTTATSPLPRASTGGYSSLSANSATISGTVDPDGQPAVYVFELGVADGANTHYGVVFSGNVEAIGTPLQEQFHVVGLQPGTTYAYRIAIKSGYGTAIGAMQTFMTFGLAEALPVPGPRSMPPAPSYKFPESLVKCKKGYKLGKHHNCLKLKAGKTRRPPTARKRTGRKHTSRR